MRAWLPVVLTLPFAFAGCPALLSDWTIRGGGRVDASADAAGAEAADGKFGSGNNVSSGSSDGSSSGGSSLDGSPRTSSGSGGATGSSGSAVGASGGGSSGGGSGGTTAAPMCPGDQKLCGGTCISRADSTPSVGCWEASCAPCASPPLNSHSVCTNGRCDFECNNGYEFSPVSNSCAPACTDVVVHNNGVGQMWLDCAALGTYSEAEAEKACEAWCGVNGGCTCTTSAICGDDRARVYAMSDGLWMSWVWDGMNPGDTVQVEPASGAGQPNCQVVGSWQ